MWACSWLQIHRRPIHLEVYVRQLHVPLYLQHVDLCKGLEAMVEVKQMLPIDKHLEPLVATANGDLWMNEGKQITNHSDNKMASRKSTHKKECIVSIKGRRTQEQNTLLKHSAKEFSSLATHLKVLALLKGVEIELSLLGSPVAGDAAVANNVPVSNSGIHVKGDVPRKPHHKVDTKPAMGNMVLNRGSVTITHRCWKLPDHHHYYYY